MNIFATFFGLNDKEYMLYEILITYGSLNITDITKHTKLHRPYAYKTIRSLIQKQFVVEGKSGTKKVYIAEQPSKLLSLIPKKQEEIVETINNLEEKYSSPQLNISVRTFQGKRAITSIYEDLIFSLKKGDVFYRYTSEKDTKYIDSLLPTNYREVRDKKGLERLVISNSSASLNKKSRLERFIKVLPQSETQFNQNCIQLIYGNKIAFIDISNLQGVIIEDVNLAQFQKAIFKLFYKKL